MSSSPPTGDEPLVFRPAPITMLRPFVALPSLGVLCGALALWAAVEGDVGYWLLAVALAALWAGCWYGAVVGYRGWFSIVVDADGISLVGLPGIGTFRLDWQELEAVGMAQVGRSRLLAVKPAVPWDDKPFVGAVQWEADRGVVGIAGGKQWVPSPGELRAAVRHYAGAKWRESLDESDDRR